MAQELISHKVLSLDFWQDTVTYAGSVMPTGTIGCAVLNIPDETITRLDAPCMILNQLLTGIGLKNVDMQLLPKAQEAGRAIIHELHDVQPFSHLDRKQFEDYLTPAFSEEAFAELNNYLQLSMEQQALSGVMGTQPLAALLIRVIPVLGHLSYSLRQYKMTLTAFAEFLQENAEIRTPIGYADARHTKYCSGYAPNDKRGRTCRQVGNLRGREQRELAPDHPIKKIYTKRFNTITQYLGRGTLDEQTAAVMKVLAKSKLEKALQDNDYAQGSYATEMEQTALLAEAKANRKQ